MAQDLTGYRNSLLAQITEEEELQRKLREDVPSVNILNNGVTNQQQSVNILNNTVEPQDSVSNRMKALDIEVETGLGTRLDNVMSDIEKKRYLNSLSEDQYNQMLQYKNEGYGFMASKALLENSHKLADPTAKGLLKYKDYAEKDAYYNNVYQVNPDSALGKFATWLQDTFDNQTPTEYLANWWNTKYGEKVAQGDETYLDRFANMTFGTLVNLLDAGVSGAMGIQDKAESRLNAKLDRDILGLETDNKFYRTTDTNLASDISKYVGSALTMAALGKFTAKHPLGMLKFNVLGATKLGEKAIDLTIGNIVRLANWTLDTIPGIRAGYRALDDQGKEALLNVATLGILHGLGKYVSPKVANTKVGNYVGEVRNAVKNSFEQGVKGAAREGRIQAEVEKAAGTKTYDYVDPVTGEKGTFDTFEGYDNRYRTRIAQASARGFREGFWNGIYDNFQNVGGNKGQFARGITPYNPNLQNGGLGGNPVGGQGGDGNSGGGSDNVNGNSNNGGLRNVKSTIGESQLATWNRMTKGEINKFFDRYGQSYTQWLIDRGFTNSYENNIQPLVQYAQKVQADKEAVLKLIPTRYVDARVNDMLREVLKRAEYTKDPDLTKIQNLVLKNSQGGLTLLDVDWIRKRYGDNIKTGFYNDNNSKEIQKADNIYYRVQEFLEQKAAENGFNELKQLNKEIAAAYHIIIGTTKRANGIQANQQITLKEAIILAGAMSNPKTRPIAVFKMMIRNAKVKDAVLKILLKGKTPKEKKQIKIDFERIIKTVEANKEAEAQKQFEEFMAKREVDTQPIENALGYDPNVGDFIDYSTPTVVTPEGQSKRWGQIAELEPKTEIKRPGTTKPAEKIVDSVVNELVKEGVVEEEKAETVKENVMDNLSEKATEKLAEVEQKLENGEELMEEEQQMVEKVADTIENNKDELVIEREQKQPSTATQTQQDLVVDQKIKPQLDQSEKKGIMYHVTTADFDKFFDNIDEGSYYNDVFGTYVTDSKPFLEDFMETKGKMGYETWKKKALDVDIKKPVLHPDGTWKAFGMKEADKLILDYLELVDRLTPDMKKMLVLMKMEDADPDNFDYDTVEKTIDGDKFTKQEIIDMNGSISSKILDLKFIGEGDYTIDELFGDSAKEDREILKKKGYDAMVVYEGDKDGEDIFSYALFYPNRYKSTTETIVEEPVKESKPMTRDDSEITGRFRNLTLEDYKKMKTLEGKENELGTLLKQDNFFGLKEQKGSSRINNFTNVIKRIVDKYDSEIDKDNHTLLINKKPYLPLEIDYFPNLQQIIVSHNNHGYDDPAIRFKITEDGKLKAFGIKQAFMEQMGNNNRMPIKDTDELLHIRAVNLEDQFLGENTIDEDTGEMKEREEPEKSDFYKKHIEGQDDYSRGSLLGRMKSDLDYIINNNLGKAGFRHLRANSPEEQIQYMRELKDSLKDSESSHKDIDIDSYEKKIKEIQNESRPMTRDDSDITGRFRNLTLEDYKKMQQFEGLETALLEDNKAPYITNKLQKLIYDDKVLKRGEIDLDEPLVIDGKITYENVLDLEKELEKVNKEIARLTKKNSENLAQEIEDTRYYLDYEALGNYGIYNYDEGEGEKIINQIIAEKNKLEKQFEQDKEAIKPLIDKYGEYRKPVEVKAQEVIGKTDTMNELQDKIKNIKTFDDFGEIFTKVEDPMNLSAMYGPGKEQYKDAYYYGKLGGKDIVIKWFAPHDRGTLNIGQGAEMSYGRPIMSELERATDNPITLEQIKAKLLNADDETIKTIGQTQESDYNTDNLQPNTTTNEQVGGFSTEASEGIQGDNGQLSNSEEILGVSMNDTRASGETSDGGLTVVTDNVEELGTRPTTGGVATRGQQRLNNQNARQILEEHNFSTDPNDYTKEEISVLRDYQGAGGLTNKGEDTLGVLDQFYTPQLIVDKMWGLANKFKSGPIELALEPSVGTGRFLRNGINFDAYEIDKFPGTIAKILNPSANVKIGDFQNEFMDYTGKRIKEYNGPKYDLVIGNPPYSHRDTPQRALGDDKKIDRFEQYFIKKGIDVLKDDGILVMIVPSTFLRNGDNYAKQEILKKATLVEAYRLPSGVFDNTDVGTDIIVFKKNGEGSTAISNNEYFEKYPEKVLGVEKERMNRFGNIEKYIEGDISELDRISTATEKILTPADKKAEAYEKKEVEVNEKPIATAKPKRKPVKRTKKDDTTIQQGTKDNLESKIVAIGDINDYDSKILDYLPKVNVDGYVEGVNPETDIDNLNYIHGNAQLNVLYFAGDIYEKLRILEDEKGQMSADLYNKQKKGLERAIPKEYTITDIVFDPNDKELLETETTLLKERQGWITNDVGEKVWGTTTKKQTIGELFRDYIRDKVPRSSGLDKHEFDKYMNGQPMSKDSKADTKRITKEYLNKFMQEELDEETQNKIVDEYNKKLRAYVRPNYEGLPLVLHNISKTFRTLKDITDGNEGKPLVLSDGQIRGINFLLLKGAGMVAHGVGHGKTMEGVVATVEAMNKGWNKRPLFVVPGPTIQDNWIHTIKELYPDKEIVNLGGLTKPDKVRLAKVLGPDPRDWIKDGQIAIISHDGLSNAIDFKTGTKDWIKADITDTMGEESDNTKKQEEKKNKIETMVEATTKASGKGYTYTVPDSFLAEKYKAMETETYDDFIENFVKDAMEEFKMTDKESLETQAKQLWSERPIFIEDLGIDHITVDEAHNFRNLFTSAKMAETGEFDKNGKPKKELNRFSNIQGSGKTSIQAKKLYFATQYVLNRNNNRNVFLLTATPFNNHVTEIYNMLSYMARKRLTDLGIKNINSFYSKFANFVPELVVKPAGKIEEKEVMKSFANAEELQRIVTEFIDYLGDRPDLIKPRKKLVAPILVNSELGKNVQTYLEDLSMMDPKEVPGAMIKATTMMMNALISPYLVPAYFEEMGESNAPGTVDLIENSPKLKFTVDVIKKMQEKGRNDGVFIFMPRFNGLGGVNYHELFRDAISEYTGIPVEQIGIVSGEGNYKKNADITAKQFRDGDIRVLIGGDNTKEGIDLQTNGYITINLLQGWNPTDRIQLNGRVWRQGNFRNEVLEVVPMIMNSGDAFMQQKFDEKSARGNNLFEFAGGKVFDTEEMNHEEMKFNLLTDVEKKVKTYIDMEAAKIKKRSEMLGGDITTLQGLKEKKSLADQIPFYQERLEQARNTNNQAQITVYTDSLKKAMYAKKYLDEKLQQLQITADEIDKEIKNKEKEIELINESVTKLKEQEPEIRRQFEEESIRQLEGMKKTDDWLNIIGNYIDNLQLFSDKQELKKWLDENADEDLGMIQETYSPKKIEIKIDEVKVENVPIEGNTPALKVDEKENFDLDTGKDYSLLDLQIFAQTTDMNVISEIDSLIKQINNLLEVNEGKEEDQKQGIHLKRDNGNYYMSVPRYRYGSKEMYQNDNYKYWNSITYDGIKRQLKNTLDDEQRSLEWRKNK